MFIINVGTGFRLLWKDPEIKISSHGKPHYTKENGGDTSIGESGSYVDDVISPKIHRGPGLARLIHVHEEGKVAWHANSSYRYLEYEYVPMVDKALHIGWK
jgi:hypothetical protein